MNHLRGWLNIYDDETGLFFWTLMLRLLVVGGFIVLNNYADTTFLEVPWVLVKSRWS